MNCDPLPECSCGAMRILTEKCEKECVMKLLMGLNENYATIHTQVLMADLMPNLNKVRSMQMLSLIQGIDMAIEGRGQLVATVAFNGT